MATRQKRRSGLGEVRHSPAKVRRASKREMAASSARGKARGKFGTLKFRITRHGGGFHARICTVGTLYPKGNAVRDSISQNFRNNERCGSSGYRDVDAYRSPTIALAEAAKSLSHSLVFHATKAKNYDRFQPGRRTRRK